MIVLLRMTSTDVGTGCCRQQSGDTQFSGEHQQSFQPTSLSSSAKSLLLYIIPVVVSMLLLLAGDVEENPGPQTYTQDIDVEQLPTLPFLTHVIYDYTAEDTDELNLTVGQMIRVLWHDEKTPSRWYGVHVDSGKGGLFPYNYVELEDGYSSCKADPKVEKHETGTDYVSSKVFINHCLGGDYFCTTALQLVTQENIVHATDGLGVTALHIACRQGRLDVVRGLVELYGLSPDLKDVNGFTPFHEACFSGSMDTVQYLVNEAKCDPHVFDCLGESGLHVASRQGWMDVVKFLVTGQHCDPKWTSHKRNTPLHIAAYWGHHNVAKFLAECCREVLYWKNAKGDTLMHIACHSGWLDVVQKLVVDSPECLYTTNSNGLSPLHLACNSRKVEVVQYLTAKNFEPVSQLSCEFVNTLLFSACKSGSTDIVQCFTTELRKLDFQGKGEHSVLHAASGCGHTNIIAFLVENGYADPNLPDPNGNTALHIACRTRNTEVVQFLTYHKSSNPILTNQNGNTPLHVACMSKSLSVVKFLVSSGLIDPNKANLAGETPLHIACKLGWLEGVEAIVTSSTCNPDLSNTKGDTPVIIAYKQAYHNIVRFLATGNYCKLDCFDGNYRPLVHLAFQDRDFAMISALATSRRCNLDLRDKHGNTILHLACQRGDWEMVLFLLGTGHCDPSLPDSAGNTILHTLCHRYRCLGVGGDGLSKEVLQYVLNGRPLKEKLCFSTWQATVPITGDRCAVSARNSSGVTALEFAVCNGAHDIVLCLLPYTELPALAKPSNLELDEVSIRDLALFKRATDSPPTLSNALLYHACKHGWLDVVKCVISCDLKVLTSDQNPLYLALIHGHLNIVQYLLHKQHWDMGKGDPDGNTVLHYACMHGRLDIVRFVVEEQGLSPHQPNKIGCSPLLLACTNGQVKVLQYLTEVCKVDLHTCASQFLHSFFVKWNINTLAFLATSADCDFNEADVYGNTPLHVACTNDDLPAIRFLLSSHRCSSLNGQNQSDNTPLHIACQKGNLKVVQCMVSQQIFCETMDFVTWKDGYDPINCLLPNTHCNTAATNNDGLTPVEEAFVFNNLDVVRFLLIEGHWKPNLLYCPECVDVDGNTILNRTCIEGWADVVKVLTASPNCNPNKPNHNGDTALHSACQASHSSIIKILSDYLECDLNAMNESGYTPLHIALNVRDTESMQYLLKSGRANPDIPDSDGNTILHLACWQMDADMVLLLHRYCNLNHKNKQGETCCHIACYNYSLDMLEVLVESGLCNPDLPNNLGKTPLYIACNEGSVDLVKYLVSGQPYQIKHTFNSSDPLAAKCLLPHHQCDPQTKSHLGGTPIQIAWNRKHWKIVRFLLPYAPSWTAPRLTLIAYQFGLLNVMEYMIVAETMDCEVVDGDGNTPLHIVSASGSHRTLQFLCSKLPHSVQNKCGDTALHIACKYERAKAVKLLIEACPLSAAKQNDYKDTPLHIACRIGNLKVVQCILSHQIVNETTTLKDGYDPVNHLLQKKQHCVCNTAATNNDGLTPLEVAFFSNNLDIVIFLLTQGYCDPNQLDNNGEALIHHVCKTGNTEMVLFLATLPDCDFSLTNVYGDSCLHQCCERGDLEMVQLLLSTGRCNPDVWDALGNTPLHLACQQGNISIVKFLLNGRVGCLDFGYSTLVPVVPSQCANPCVRNIQWETLFSMAFLHGQLDVARVLVHYQDYCMPLPVNGEGNTMLHEACKAGWTDCVKSLLTMKHCDPNHQNSLGHTALHICGYSGHKHLTMLLLRKRYSDKIMADKEGNTLLHIACLRGWTDVVELLLNEYEIKYDLKNSQGRTPVDIACAEGNLELVKRLASRGCIPPGDKVQSKTVSPLLFASKYSHSLNVLDFLISRMHWNPCQADDHGETALHIACYNGNLPAVQYLLTRKCDCLNKQTCLTGETPLQLACRKSNFEIVEYIVTGEVNRLHFPIVCRNTLERYQLNLDHIRPTALQIAWMMQNLDLLKLLIPYHWKIPESVDKDGNTILNRACIEGWTELARMLTTNPNCNPNKPNHKGDTALHSACQASHSIIVTILSNCPQCDLNAVNGSGHTPLHVSFNVRDLQSIQYLLTSGRANPDIPHSDGNTIFHLACWQMDADMVLLLHRYCNLNHKNKQGETCCHIACYNYSLDMLEVLVESGLCNPDLPNNLGRTPLDIACNEGSVDLVKYLVSGQPYHDPVNHLLQKNTHCVCNTAATNSEGLTPLEVAFFSKNFDIVRFLLTQGHCDPNHLDNNGEALIHHVCKTGNTEMVLFLATLPDCDFSLTNVCGDSCLHQCCERGDLEMVQLLLSTGCCNPDVRNAFGDTPLHLACQQGNMSMVKFLLNGRVGFLDVGYSIFVPVVPSQCANPCIQNIYSKTPFDVAFRHGLLDVARVLVHYQDYCMTLPVNGEGNTMLHEACKAGWTDCVKSLLTMKHCDPNHQNSLGQTALHVCGYSGHKHLTMLLLRKQYSDKIMADKDGNTLLHIACLRGWTDVVELLNEYESKYDLKNSQGCAPIDIACAEGNFELVKRLAIEGCIPSWDEVRPSTVSPLLFASKYSHSLNVLDFLISRMHWNPCQADDHGETALHVACYNGNLPAVQYLLTKKCECLNKQVHQTGDTPLQLACRRSNFEIVEYIVTGEVNKLYFPLADSVCRNNLPEGYQLNLDHIRPTALQIAWSMQKLDLLKLLIPYHWKIPESVDKDGNTILNRACIDGWTELARMLTTNPNCNPNKPNHKGDTALHSACQASNSTTVKILSICPQCDLNAVNTSDHPALHVAFNVRDLQSMKYILTSGRANPEIPDSDGNTVFHRACIEGDLSVIELLSNHGHSPLQLLNHNGHTALIEAYLHWYARESDNIVNILIQNQHVNPQEPDSDGNTLLHHACLAGDSDTVHFLLSNRYCSPNHRNKKGNTCCHIACSANGLAVLKLLVESTLCEPDLPNEQGETPLYIACQEGNEDIVRYLLHGGYSLSCDPQIKTYSHRTAIHIAWEHNHVDVVRLLVPYSVPKAVHCKGLLHTACKLGWTDVVEYLTVTGVSNCEEVDGDGNTPLHVVSQSGSLKILQLLCARHPHSIQNNSGDTPLHIACKYERTMAVKLLVDTCPSSTVKHNNAQDTPLHIACAQQLLVIARMLLFTRHWDLECTNMDGNTALHLACAKRNIELVKLLVSRISPKHPPRGDSPSPTINACCVQNDDADTPLHLACSQQSLEIAKTLLSTKMCDLQCTDANGNTALHLACATGNTKIVELLASCTSPKCPPRGVSENLSSNAIRHCCMQNNDGDTPLHVACNNEKFEAAHHLVNICSLSLEVQNASGDTPIHIACAMSDFIFIEFLDLLGAARMYVLQLKNSEGKTPIQLTTDYDIIRELIGYGADPRDLYDHFKSILTECKQNYPLESLVKVFVCGNSGIGKSTLAKALQRERKGTVQALTKRVTGAQVKDVDQGTAGIQLTKFHSKQYGHVLLYDFAGQHEYYGSHSAVLDITLSSSAPVFFVVLNLTEEPATLAKQLEYWISFISNHCRSTLAKPHIIVVGSHLDRLKAKGEDLTPKKELIIQKATEETSQSAKVQFVKYVQLDCRKVESPGMTTARSILADCCSQLRCTVEVDIRCCVLYALLTDRFLGLPAVRLSQIANAVKEMELPLPYVAHEMLSLLSVLNDRGYILLLTNREESQKSWIVRQQSVLLQEVNGTIFAPKQFKQTFKNLASATGVVPVSKIQEVFSTLDTNMIVQLLIHLEYCRKITDSTILSSLAPSDAEDSTCDYYFFPALIKEERPERIWEPVPNQTYQSCWCLRRTKPSQFFTPRFLQVLLLRLLYAVVPETVLEPSVDADPDPMVLTRPNCTYNVWKNGLQWTDNRGNCALVEVIEQSTAVVVLNRCQHDDKVDCVRLRSKIIWHVLNAKNEFCSSIGVTESLLDPQQLQTYPFQHSVSELAAFSVRDIAKAITQGDPYVQCHTTDATSGMYYREMMSLVELLHFEPYCASVKHCSRQVQWRETLEKLFKEENLTEPLPNEDLEEFAKFSKADSATFAEILGVEISDIEDSGSSNVRLLSKVLCHWKDQLHPSECTYHKFRWELGQCSIFCGRSLLCPTEAPPKPPIERPRSLEVEDASGYCVTNAVPTEAHEESSPSMKDDYAQPTLTFTDESGTPAPAAAGTGGSLVSSLEEETTKPALEGASAAVSTEVGVRCTSFLEEESTEPAPEDQRPWLPELLRFHGRHATINIPQEISTKFKTFGVFLLDDKTGARVDALVHQHRENAEAINQAILQEWLQGMGIQPVTWQTLVDVLKDCQLNRLADDIREIKLL